MEYWTSCIKRFGNFILNQIQLHLDLGPDAFFGQQRQQVQNALSEIINEAAPGNQEAGSGGVINVSSSGSSMMEFLAGNMLGSSNYTPSSHTDNGTLASKLPAPCHPAGQALINIANAPSANNISANAAGSLSFSAFTPATPASSMQCDARVLSGSAVTNSPFPSPLGDNLPGATSFTHSPPPATPASSMQYDARVLSGSAVTNSSFMSPLDGNLVGAASPIRPLPPPTKFSTDVGPRVTDKVPTSKKKRAEMGPAKWKLA
ncbi:hypothetical protein F5879DRAFT_928023, partial [Lentinula edodes]